MSIKNDFLTKIYKDKYKDIKEIKKVSVYSTSNNKMNHIYIGFEYKKVEHILSYHKKGVDFDEYAMRKLMVRKVVEYEDLRTKIKNNKATHDDRVMYLVNYAVRKCGLQYSERDDPFLNIEGDLEIRLNELARGTLSSYKEASDEMAKEIYKLSLEKR